MAGDDRTPLRFGLLGEVRGWSGDQELDLGSPQQRALLAVLALRADQAVSSSQLIEALWGEDPPASAAGAVYTYVARLRRVLDPGLDRRGAGQVLVNTGTGYRLRLSPDRIDIAVEDECVRTARRLRADGRLADSAAAYEAALDLWHGQPLAGVPGPFAEAQRARLTERRLDVSQERAEVMLELGRGAEVVAELTALARRHPLREQLHALLMRALYQCGRQAEALDVYTQTRRLLVAELGIEPGGDLQRAHRQVLAAAADMPPSHSAGPPGAHAADVSGAEREDAAGDAAEGQRPSASAPAQLPPDINDFTGRVAALVALDGLLAPTARVDGYAPVAIVGSGGVGKTALAVHWAHTIADRFPDGQLYLDLHGYSPARPVTPAEAVARLLRSLGVPAGRIPVDVEEAAALYRSLLADKKTLVLLDNVNEPDQVRPLLPGGPGCLVVLTSRERLSGLMARDGVHRLHLDVLTAAEALSLLTRILGPARIGGERAAVAELARACAYLPLSLRIAATNLTDHPSRAIATQVEQLLAGNRLAALRVEGDEQTAVRATFDLSYLTLADPVRRLFRLLGLVPGPDIGVDAVAALADMTPVEVEPLLDRLAGAHLVNLHTSGRYTLHDLLRLYAAERSEHDDSRTERSAALTRLFEWYLRGADAAARLLYPDLIRIPLDPVDPALPQPAIEDHAQATAWLNIERANLVAAVQHAGEHGPRPVAWLLADALHGYFWLHTHLADWLTTAQVALDCARAEGEPIAQAAACHSIGDLHRRQSHHKQALDYYYRMLSLYQSSGNIEGQGAALFSIAHMHREAGRLALADELVTKAWGLNGQAGLLTAEVLNVAHLGALCHERGDLQRALGHYTRALELHRKLGSRHGEAVVLANLGEVWHGLGRLDAASEHLSQALAILREIDYPASEAEAVRRLAAVHADLGRHNLAMEAGRGALVLARDCGDRRVEVDALNTLGVINRRIGRHEQGADCHERARSLARELGRRRAECVALVELGSAKRELGQPGDATRYLEQASAIAGQAGYRALAERARAALAECRTVERSGAPAPGHRS